MAERIYTWIAVPLDGLFLDSYPLIISLFDLFPGQLQQLLAEDPSPYEAAGQDDVALRNIAGRICIVWERSDCPDGGESIALQLWQQGVPFLHRSGNAWRTTFIKRQMPLRL